VKREKVNEVQNERGREKEGSSDFEIERGREGVSERERV